MGQKCSKRQDTAKVVSKGKRQESRPVDPRGSSRLGQRHLQLVTEVPKEVVKLVLSVKNISALLATAAQSQTNVNDKDVEKNILTRWKFGAGDSIGEPSKWEIVLKNTNDRLVFQIFCEECSTKSEVYAKFNIKIKLSSGKMVQTDFKNTNKFRTRPNRSGRQVILQKIIVSTISSLLKNDCLTLKVSLEIFGSPIQEQEKVRIGFLKHVRLDDLQNTVQKMMLYPELTHADITLHFTKDETKRKAHKCILSDRSPVFKAMFENNLEESTSGTVVIHDIGSEAMNFVLGFMYTGDLTSTSNDKEMTWLKYAEEVVYASNKYDLPILKEFCDHNLLLACNNDNALDLLKLAFLHELRNAAVEVSEFINKNIHSIIPVQTVH